MEDTNPIAQHEQLLEHQDFLRRLASGLVLDHQSADDLVQEACLTGILHPPRHGANLRAWLGRVRVNRARSDRRTAIRRAQREQQVARTEALPPDEEAVLRIELQRELLSALSRLPDATRTTMVMRYYEGLTPLEIASRLETSQHTVKSQLRRGLEAMRKELDHGYGGDRWALVLAPLVERGTTSSVAAAGLAAIRTTAMTWIGATAMTTTKWVMVGVVVLMGAITALLVEGVELDPPRERTLAQGDDGSRSLAQHSSEVSLAGSLAEVGGTIERRVESSPQPDVAEVLMQRSWAALIVRDAKNGVGIEDFVLLSRDLSSDMVRDLGTFHAPGGRLSASDDPGIIDFGDGHRSFTVWAAGYGAKTVVEENFGRSSEVVVELEPGVLPTVRGVVMNRGIPEAGAEVSLNPYRRISWLPSELTALVKETTDRRGRFELYGAPGHYILRVVCDAGSVFHPVELPVSEPLTIELGGLGSVVLTVRDAAGLPLPNIISILRRKGESGRGRQERCETDEQGRARFSDVEPGELHLTLHGTMEHFHNSPWVEQEFTLAPGADLELLLAAPGPGGSRRARLVVDGGTPQGWYARMRQGGSDEWSPASAQGEIDIDLNLGSFVELRNPKYAVWTWSIPPYSPGEDVLEIHVPAAQFVYRGRVLSRNDGTPVDCKVQCSLQPGGVGAMSSVYARTDADGRFLLPVSEDAVTALRFETDGSTGGDRFKPDYVPSASPPLELSIFLNNTYRTDPHIPLTPVVGLVTDARDGSAVVGGSLRIRAIYDDPQGTYEVGINSSNSQTDAEGRYSVDVPVAAHYVVDVWTEWTKDGRRLTAKKGRLHQGDKAVWDLVIPNDSK